MIQCGVTVKVNDDEVATCCIVGTPVTFVEVSGTPPISVIYPTKKPLKADQNVGPTASDKLWVLFVDAVFIDCDLQYLRRHSYRGTFCSA